MAITTLLIILQNEVQILDICKFTDTVTTQGIHGISF